MSSACEPEPCQLQVAALLPGSKCASHSYLGPGVDNRYLRGVPISPKGTVFPELLLLKGAQPGQDGGGPATCGGGQLGAADGRPPWPTLNPGVLWDPLLGSYGILYWGSMGSLSKGCQALGP